MSSTMTCEAVLDRLALILAGLQVPLSIDPHILGSAAEPFRQLLHDSGFGWRNEYDFREYLRSALEISRDEC